MTKLVADFKYGTLSAGIGSTDTTITSAEFADLPVVSSPDTMDLVLNPGEVGGDAEIVTVTAHTSSSTSVTVAARTGSAHGSGTQWVHAVTAADFNRMGFDGTLEGNADTATALETARTIGGVSFDGTANINLPGVNTAGNQDTSGNAATATKWSAATTLSLAGDASGSVVFDGSDTTETLTVTVANDSHTHDGRYYTESESDARYLQLTGGTMTGELQLNARLDVGNGSNGNHEIRIYKSDNNVSDHIQFYNGTTRVGEIGCEDTTWLRINQETAKNIYSPRLMRADGGFSTNVGSAGSPTFSFHTDTNTGMYLVSADRLGFTTGGGLRAEVRSDGIHLANGDWFRSYGSAGWYNGTYGGGWYMTDSSWLRAYNNKGISTGGTYSGVNLSTTSGSGFNYLFRNATYGTFYYYTSTRELKENIVNVDAADAGTWIDALQPVTFIEKWVKDEEEPEDHKTWREADVQTGFIAEDVLSDPVTSRFAQVVDDGNGGLQATGWKWECVIATAVAEIKALRARVATLEAG